MTNYHKYRGSNKKWAPYKSKLEKDIATALTRQGLEFEYEPNRIKFTVPARETTYTPDFVLPNGIVVEAKGPLTAADRKKFLLIREQHPEIDIRFVFDSPRTKIDKRSTTTVADWCDKNGFKWARRWVPKEWFDE